MKRNIKYFIIILVGIAVIGFVFHQNAKSNYLKKNYCNNIDKAILVGEKYSNELNDTNRIKFIKELKNLVFMYAEIRDSEDGNKAYNAKFLCVFLSSAYDILEVDKNQADQLNDLLDALHMLKLDPFDESGEALDRILSFVKASAISFPLPQLADIIKEKQIEEDNNYGACKIQYPYIAENAYDKVNQIIEDTVKKESYYNEIFGSDAENSSESMYNSITLNYKIGKSDESVLSIFFEGSMRNTDAAHPLNLAFALNLDIESGECLKLDQFVDIDKVRTQMVDKIKEQITDESYQKDLLHAWETHGEEQLDNPRNFYLQDNKAYFVIKIPAGSEAYEVICLD